MFRSFFRWSCPVALTSRPTNRRASRGDLLKSTSTEERRGAAGFVKGDTPKTIISSVKKKTMKTTSKKSSGSELNNRSHHQSEQPTAAAAEAPSAVAPVAEQTAAPAAKPDNRLPIDSEARKQNRTLPTPKVLNALFTSLPDVYRVAEVVGKWVWVTFKEQPAAEIRQQLAQLGFHWNRDRQAWQHPCGQFSLSSSSDPHEKYSSYRPASVRRNANTTTPQEAAA